MTDRILELVLDEGKWLTTAMLLSGATVVALARPRRKRGRPLRRDLLWAMNQFYAGMIGIMAFGHLLAVTVKAIQGNLAGSPWLLYPMGVALAVPSWWLALRVGRFVDDEERWRKRMVALNACLGIALLALGLHNFPLAVPAALNIAYQFHSRRAVGWTIVTANVATNLALFVGSLVFLASDRSFEDFQAM